MGMAVMVDNWTIKQSIANARTIKPPGPGEPRAEVEAAHAHQTGLWLPPPTMADSHHSLPLTQTSERSPHIFVDASGSPLSVYLDVNPEILARPRLTRLLRVGIDILTVMNVFVCLMLVI